MGHVVNVSMFQVDPMNRVVFTHRSGIHTYWASGSHCIYEHVSHAFQRLAARYNLHDHSAPEARGHFLMDAWSGFFSKNHGEDIRRDRFYETHNLEKPFKPPGGWSSHGQPCDQVHAQLRNKLRALDVSSLGFCGDLRNRPRI